MNSEMSRRTVLKGSAAGGAALVLGFRLADGGDADAGVTDMAGTTAPLAPSQFLRVDADGSVTVVVHRSEMGQRVDTALPMIVADELEADWTSVRIEHALADPIYGDQFTGGSASVSSSFGKLRRAAAMARTMLVTAAATTWGVDAATCRAENGAVVHDPSGRRLAYGQLVETAAALPVPTLRDVTLKDPADFRIIGTRVADVNAREFATGRGLFASDISLPGMLVAAIARSPRVVGSVSTFDPRPALSVDGVRQVVEVSSGVAVAADTTWAALRGRAALPITWTEGYTKGLDSSAIREATAKGLWTKSGSGFLEAVYEIPFLAHVTMEPMTCVADVRADSCEVWAPTQDRQGARSAAAAAAGLPEEAVTVHVPLIGGGFGRRLGSDYVTEAVEVSREVQAPVKVVWTREDDIQHDFYHPFSLSYRRAALTQPWSMLGNTAEGYGPPTGPWRSVGNVAVAFADGCFIDELASATGQDVLELHRAFGGRESLQPVLDLAAEKAGWGKPLPAGWGRGLATHSTFGVTPAAMVVEVSVIDGRLRVRRVVCAIDCGRVIDPAGVEAQMEGGIVFALSAALHGEITLRKGHVEQSCFLDYPILRMDEMPTIEVYRLESDDDPRGVGEMGVPPTAPALLNAVFAATGRRIRHLPIRTEDLA